MNVCRMGDKTSMIRGIVMSVHVIILSEGYLSETSISGAFFPH